MLAAFVAFATAAAIAGPAASQPLVRDRDRAEFDAGFAAYEAGDARAAVAAFTRLAERGDALAQYNVAVIRLREESPATPLPTALRYLRASAQAGFPRAQHLLGTLHETGRHVRRSQRDALDWFVRAARQGLTEAQLAAGTQYYLGRGTAQDYAQAARWYARAAEAGDVAAQYLVASMHEEGLGVPRDLRAALEWYAAAARQGDPAAHAKARDVADRLAGERDS
jgi:TPR repeat protein